MKNIIKHIFLGIFIAMILSGCASSKFRSSTEVLELDGNPTTGYTWSYTLDDESLVTIEEDIVYLGKKGIVGAPSRFEYKFKSTNPGETKIRFSYNRPWLEDSEIESKTFLIKVAEDGSIKLEEIKEAN